MKQTFRFLSPNVTVLDLPGLAYPGTPKTTSFGMCVVCGQAGLG